MIFKKKKAEKQYSYQLKMCYNEDFEHSIILGESRTPFEDLITIAVDEVCNAQKQNLKTKLYVDIETQSVKIHYLIDNVWSIYFATKIH